MSTTIVTVHNSDMQEWLKSASEETISKTFEFGWRTIRAANLIIPPTVSEPTTPAIYDYVTPSGAGSSDRGKKGEISISEFLSRNGYEVRNVTKRAKSGDLIVVVNNRRILVEIKNYTNTVPHAEYVKFQRDIELCNPDAALFISIDAKIGRIKDPCVFDTEILATKSVPICALVVSATDISGILLVLQSLTVIMEYVNKPVPVPVQENLGTVSAKDIEIAGRLIEGAMRSADKLRAQLSSIFDASLKGLVDIHANVKGIANVLAPA